MTAVSVHVSPAVEASESEALNEKNQGPTGGKFQFYLHARLVLKSVGFFRSPICSCPRKTLKHFQLMYGLN